MYVSRRQLLTWLVKERRNLSVKRIISSERLNFARGLFLKKFINGSDSVVRHDLELVLHPPKNVHACMG